MCACCARRKSNEKRKRTVDDVHLHDHYNTRFYWVGMWTCKFAWKPTIEQRACVFASARRVNYSLTNDAGSERDDQPVLLLLLLLLARSTVGAVRVFLPMRAVHTPNGACRFFCKLFAQRANAVRTGMQKGRRLGFSISNSANWTRVYFVFSAKSPTVSKWLDE